MLQDQIFIRRTALIGLDKNMCNLKMNFTLENKEKMFSKPWRFEELNFELF